MVKSCFRFIERNGSFLFSLVMVMVLAALGDTSMLLADATVVAPGGGASEGSEGLSTQMNGQDGSVSNLSLIHI